MGASAPKQCAALNSLRTWDGFVPGHVESVLYGGILRAWKWTGGLFKSIVLQTPPVSFNDCWEEGPGWGPDSPQICAASTRYAPDDTKQCFFNTRGCFPETFRADAVEALTLKTTLLCFYSCAQQPEDLCKCSVSC